MNCKSRHIPNSAVWQSQQPRFSCLRLPVCVCACAVALSCPTLCDLMDCSLPGSSVLGISQTRILEWVARSSSRGSSRCRDRTISPASAGRFFTTEPPKEAASTGRVKFKTGNPGDSESLWIEPCRLVHTNWAWEPAAQFRLIDANIINPWLFNRSLLLGPYFLDN